MRTQKLLMLKGLPASGKSTLAKELVKDGWKRVNKDDLREMLDSSIFNKSNEKFVKDTELRIAVEALRLGYSVVVDDTNFAYEDFWKKVALGEGVEFEVKFFDTPIQECIERDSKRGNKSVGAKVIFRMYEQYLQPKEPAWSEDKTNAFVFDIDGTLAKMDGRSPYDYSKVNTDKVKPNVAMLTRMIKTCGLPVIVVSGRPDSCKVETMQWLARMGIPYNELHMRLTGDSRKDSIIKKEIYDNVIKDRYNVLGVFDDRNQVVDMWRSLGLTVFQVAYGYF